MNNSYPIVSVIVPVYNVEDFLSDCIESIINQTYDNLEIILVDDGSKDSSGKICDEYQSKDERIKVIHKPNGGLSDARNAGIEVSTGEYISFIDSDDFIDLNTYERLIPVLLNHKADILRFDYKMYGGGKYQKHSPHYKAKGITFYKGLDALKSLLTSQLNCSAWDKIYRKEVIGDTRFIKGRLNEDIIFLFEILQKTNVVVETNDVLYFYRVRNGSISNGNMISSLDMLKNYDEMIVMMQEKKLPIEKEMKRYRNTCNIHFCRKCILCKSIKDYKRIYDERRGEVVRLLPKFLLSKADWKGKAWAVIISFNAG